MDGSEVKEIERLVNENMTIEEAGVLFARSTFKPVMYCPRPSAIKSKTLTGFLDYIKDNREKAPLEECMIHIESYESVRLIAGFDDLDKGRTVFVAAELDKELPVFPFDKYMDPESFIIKAKALFVPSEELDNVVAMASRVVAQNEIITKDDGLSQEVSVRKGVSGALKGSEENKGMYALRPWRTFRELEQPKSSFILRFKATDGIPQIALFDAEGGIWRNTAVMAIKEYILDQLVSSVDIPVIA